MIALFGVFSIDSLITKIMKHGRWRRKELIKKMINPLFGFNDRHKEKFLWVKSRDEKKHVLQCLLRNKFGIKHTDRKPYSCSIESITVGKGLIIFVDI